MVVVLVVVGGLVMTALAANAVRHAQGVYAAQIQYQIVPPADVDESNEFTSPANSAISVAGIVAMKVDPSRRNRFASPSATLLGAGVRHGWWVKLPDSGGQWASAFSDPWLDIEVVDTDPDQVRDLAQQKVAEVTATLKAIQDEVGVTQAKRFTARVNPPGAIPLEYHSGRANAGAAMTVILGTGLTIALSSWLASLLRLGRVPRLVVLRRLGLRAR